ncbi:MAG: potassium channel family protein [Actinomycetota bacterium]|nr:potassium channel family protein [Actinomycetota bacterium]
MLPKLLWPVVGGVTVLLIAWDVILTLLHPTARGPVSYISNRATWDGARALARRFFKGRGLSYAGPLAVAGNVLAWVLGLWIGFALAYLPFIGTFSFDPATPFAGKGLLEALYFSGTVLTTAGFGDVVPTGSVLRVIAVVEAASGFGALSAAIAYVLSLYPLTTELRSTALQLADHGVLEFSGAVRVVRDSGTSVLPAVFREMTEAHEHLRRFPVLYYFESGDEEEPLRSLVRGGALLLVALRCAHPEVNPHAPLYADVMEAIVDRLLGDLERDFVGGRRSARGPHKEDDDNQYDISKLCASVDPQFAAPEHVEHTEELASLLARTEAVLAAIAEEHSHRADPLFPTEP